MSWAIWWTSATAATSTVSGTPNGSPFTTGICNPAAGRPVDINAAFAAVIMRADPSAWKKSCDDEVPTTELAQLNTGFKWVQFLPGVSHSDVGTRSPVKM